MSLAPLILYISGITIALIAIPVLLGSKYQGNPAKRLLTVFIAIIAVQLLEKLLLGLGLHNHWPHLHMSTFPFYFALPPLLYLYIRLLTDPEFKLQASTGWHFLPCLLAAAILLPFYLTPAEEKLALAAQYDAIAPMGRRSISWILAPYSLSMMIYGVLGLRWLHQHRHRIQQLFSDTGGRSLNWLYIFTLITMTIGLALLLPLPWPGGEILYQTIATVVLLYALCYFAIGQPSLYDNGSEPKPAKYEKSGLEPGQQKQLYQLLLKHFEAHQPYLIPALSLADLAQQLEISNSHLSQVINDSAGVSFFDLINGYRVEHAKQLLDNNQLAVIDIGMEAGFNSKTAFYQQFKKITGYTPGQYRKKSINS